MGREFSVWEYKRMENVMGASQSLCTAVIAGIMIYIIGLSGLLDCDGITLEGAGIRLIVCLVLTISMILLKAGARQLQIRIARKRIFLANGWCL